MADVQSRHPEGRKIIWALAAAVWLIGLCIVVPNLMRVRSESQSEAEKVRNCQEARVVKAEWVHVARVSGSEEIEIRIRFTDQNNAPFSNAAFVVYGNDYEGLIPGSSGSVTDAAGIGLIVRKPTPEMQYVVEIGRERFDVSIKGPDSHIKRASRIACDTNRPSLWAKFWSATTHSLADSWSAAWLGFIFLVVYFLLFGY